MGTVVYLPGAVALTSPEACTVIMKCQHPISLIVIFLELCQLKEMTEIYGTRSVSAGTPQCCKDRGFWLPIIFSAVADICVVPQGKALQSLPAGFSGGIQHDSGGMIWTNRYVNEAINKQQPVHLFRENTNFRSCCLQNLHVQLLSTLSTLTPGYCEIVESTHRSLSFISLTDSITGFLNILRKLPILHLLQVKNLQVYE